MFWGNHLNPIWQAKNIFRLHWNKQNYFKFRCNRVLLTRFCLTFTGQDCPVWWSLLWMQLYGFSRIFAIFYFYLHCTFWVRESLKSILDQILWPSLSVGLAFASNIKDFWTDSLAVTRNKEPFQIWSRKAYLCVFNHQDVVAFNMRSDIGEKGRKNFKQFLIGNTIIF